MNRIILFGLTVMGTNWKVSEKITHFFPHLGTILKISFQYVKT